MMEGFCRGCLIRYDESSELLHYTEKKRRLFVYSTGLQVKRNDSIAFQLCKCCLVNMKAACSFKKLCRASDKKLKSYFSLKDAGVSVDFCTFLKNNDDTMSFQLPLVSGSSTPANYNKTKDDDNESTCTSIRNFMTDILQCEDMPDSEASIIREVIEEEADLLDDTLDSHWLRDDDSIDIDLRLDLNFSPFTTPHSINNDHCYTPKRFNDIKEDPPHIKRYFTSISPMKNHRSVNNFTDVISHNQSEKELCISNVNDTNNEEATEDNKIGIRSGVKSIHAVYLTTIKEEIPLDELNLKTEENDILDLNLPLNKNAKMIPDFNLPVAEDDKSVISLDISIDSNKLINSLHLPLNDSEISMNNAELPSFDSLPSIPSVDNELMNSSDLPITDNEKDYKYSTSKEIEKIVSGKLNNKKICKENACSIDKNLERALRDKDAAEYLLDDLLVSPKVESGASTPTISNILFGEKINRNQKSISKRFVTLKGATDRSPLTNSLLKENANIINDVQNKTSENNIQEDLETYKECIQNVTSEFYRETKVIKDVHDSPDDVDEVDFGKEIMEQEIILSQYDEHQFDLENFFCNICKKKYQSVKSLCIHSAKKHNIKIIKPKNKDYISKPRICQICGREFRNLQNFHRHLKRHKKSQEPEIYKCDHCTLEFASIHTLRRHKASLKPETNKNKSKKHICTICGATSTTIGNFRLHQRRHLKKYAYNCNDCGKGFYRRSELTVHMRHHTGEKPFPCVHCERKFSRKDALIKHVKIHINDRPFQCEYCSEKFPTNSRLKVHIRGSLKCKRKRGIIPDKIRTSKKVKDVNLKIKDQVCDDTINIGDNMYKDNIKVKINDQKNVIYDDKMKIDDVLMKMENEDNHETIDSEQVLFTELPYIDTEMSN